MSKDVFNGRDPFDNFDERFDKNFNRILDVQEKVLDHPIRTMILAGLVWLAGFIIVLAVIAFFVSLFI